mgnify:CR=1 FL=1
MSLSTYDTGEQDTQRGDDPERRGTRTYAGA